MACFSNLHFVYSLAFVFFYVAILCVHCFYVTAVLTEVLQQKKRDMASAFKKTVIKSYPRVGEKITNDALYWKHLQVLNLLSAYVNNAVMYWAIIKYFNEHVQRMLRQ